MVLFPTCYGVLLVSLFSFSLGNDDLEDRLLAMIGEVKFNCEETVNNLKTDFEQRQQDLEARVLKLEELVKI